MNDRQLRLFLIVADHGSFSSAEATAFVSKQALIKQINALEDEIGVPLFLRSNEGLSLTPAGERFCRGAKEMLALREQVVLECRNASQAQDVLRVGQVEHQALLSAVTDAYAAKYPDVAIKKVIHPNHSGEYRVENGIIDVGETFYTDHTASRKFAYTRLCDMPYLVTMRPGHPLSAQPAVPLSALTAYPTTAFSPMVKPEYLDALRAAFGVRPENLVIRRDVDNQVSAAFACSESDALLLTANCFVRHMPEVVTLPLAEGWSKEYGVIYRPNPPPTVRKFIDLAVYMYTHELKQT